MDKVERNYTENLKHKNLNPDGSEMTWDDVLAAMSSDYNYSVKRICMMLKASRNWVNKYIVPHLTDCIYISNGLSGGLYYGVPWNRVASMQLGRQIREQVYFKDDSVQVLLTDSIQEASRQTRVLPVEYLMNTGSIRDFHKTYDEYGKRIEDLKTDGPRKNVKEILTLQSAQNTLWKSFVTSDVLDLIVKNAPEITKRGDIERVHVDLTSSDIFNISNNWRAVHDEKDYGDTDEKVYRLFFNEGLCRFELVIPDAKTGESGVKVFYFKDPKDIEIPDTRQTILVKESTWTEIKRQMGIE